MAEHKPISNAPGTNRPAARQHGPAAIALQPLVFCLVLLHSRASEPRIHRRREPGLWRGSCAKLLFMSRPRPKRRHRPWCSRFMVMAVRCIMQRGCSRIIRFGRRRSSFIHRDSRRRAADGCEGKKTGWQGRAGDQDDRDLKFFDAVLESLKEDYRLDEKRIFATGHSNAAVSLTCYGPPGDRLAAVAPCAAAAAGVLGQLKPKPVLHLAGENDSLVKFAWQKATMDALRPLNECGEGQPWEKWCTLYPSKSARR